MANDPTHWVDPSGHLADPIPAASAIWDAVSQTTVETETFFEACALSPGCAGLVAAGSAVETAAAFVPLVAGIYATFAILICELDTGSSGSWSSSSGPAGTVWEFSVHTWGCMTSWDTYTRLALRLGSPGPYSPPPAKPALPQIGSAPPDDSDEPACEPHTGAPKRRPDGYVRHHVYPIEFKAIWRTYRIPFNRCTVEIPAELHVRVHDGGVPSCGAFNDQWKNFLGRIPQPSRHEVIQFQYELVARCGLARYTPYVSYDGSRS